MLYKYFIAGIFLFAFTSSVFYQKNGKIENVFKEFQQGYLQRDTSAVDKFADDLCTKDIQVVGTGATETLNGITSAKNLFRNDWLYRFSVTTNTDSLRLIATENSAYFILPAVASISFPDKDAAYDFALKRFEQTTGNKKTSREKLLGYSSQSSELIQQIESGSLEIKYVLRITGALLKQDGKCYLSN